MLTSAPRRTGTATSHGVTVEQICEHVLQSMDGLEKILRSKIYNLFKVERAEPKFQ